MSPQMAVEGVWAVWVVSWFIAAAWSARTRARPKLGSEVAYRVITLIGVALLFDRNWRRDAAISYWMAPSWAEWSLVALAVAGFAFCWWARLHLGSLWSGSVTRKEGHRIVDTGPYALVRHPIYTGIIIASAATAALAGTWISAAGLALVTLGCWIKARLEERFLRAELGPSDYDAYARRTGMLLPFL
jgi:protein-S-isoprenylcysteine O-methyltransferase Ste14